MARSNKGQHKIPRIYLEAFTDKQGFVWIINRDLKLYRQKPLNTLIEKDYYTIKFQTGSGTLNIETKFLGGIETEYSSIYKETLSKGLPVSDIDKAKLSIFIASMMERQPMVRESMKKFFSDVEEKINHMRSLPDHVKKRLSQMPTFSGDGLSISADEMLQAGQDVRSFHSSLIPETVIEIAPIIFKMKWTFMLRSENSEPFITSDNPCVRIDPVGEKKFGRGSFGAAPGLIYNDVELTLPLSSDMALICGWQLMKDCRYITIDDNLVKEINYRTKRHAGHIVGSDKSMLEAIIQSIKKRNDREKTINSR